MTTDSRNRPAAGEPTAAALPTPTLSPHDCHVHMVLDGDDFRAALARHAEAPDERAVHAVLERYAAAGFRYLREGGDRQGAGWLARRLAGGYGIEYASPVFPIFQKGNYGGFIGRGFETFAEYRTLVDEVEGRGGDYIKLMLTGIMDFDEFGRITGYPLPRGLVEEMIGYAHERGLAVMAHVNGADAVRDAVEAGVDSVEHGYFTDETAQRALAESGAVWVPTFAPIVNLIGTGRFPDGVLRRIWKSQAAAVARVAAMGGFIACGSDAGAAEVRHVSGAADEMACLRQALLGKAATDDPAADTTAFDASADATLARGLDEVRRRFPSRG